MIPIKLPCSKRILNSLVVIRDHNGLVQLVAWRMLTNFVDAKEAEAVRRRPVGKVLCLLRVGLMF